MRIIKYRIINKYRILFLVFSLLGMFAYWGVSSKFFELTIGFNGTAESQSKLLAQTLTLDNYMDILGFATTVMVVLLFSTVILFYNEKRGLFSFRYVRGERQKKVLISTILSHAAINAVLYYIIYVIYLSIGYLFIGSNMSSVPRNTFDVIFGQGFSSQYAYLYYLVEGIPSFLIATFVYTIMTCSIALFCRKTYQCIIYMLSYYWGLQILIEFLRKAFMGPNLAFLFVMFEPTFIFGFQGYSYDNPSIGLVFQVMSSLIIPILISIVLITVALRKEEKLYE